MENAGATLQLVERAVLVVVDDREETRERVARMLERRFGPDYEIIACATGTDGYQTLFRLYVVESEALGGQASTSSLIRNYLGFPRGLSGAELASRAYMQAWFFGARFGIGRQAVDIRGDGPWRVVAMQDG